MRTSESECIESLQEAAEILGESPTSAQYADLGLTPAQGTIQRVIHSASAYPRLQARVKRTIAYTSTADSRSGFPTVYDNFNSLQEHSV